MRAAINEIRVGPQTRWWLPHRHYSNSQPDPVASVHSFQGSRFLHLSLPCTVARKRKNLNTTITNEWKSKNNNALTTYELMKYFDCFLRPFYVLRQHFYVTVVYLVNVRCFDVNSRIYWFYDGFLERTGEKLWNGMGCRRECQISKLVRRFTDSARLLI